MNRLLDERLALVTSIRLVKLEHPRQATYTGSRGGTKMSRGYDLLDCPLCQEKNNASFYVEDDIPLYRCAECGLVYPSIDKTNTPNQSKNWDNKYQSLISDHPSLDTWPHRQRIYEQFFDNSALEGTSGTLLDVGCADGQFLDVARSHGWQTTGIEPSLAAAEYARTERELNVHHGYLGEDVLPVASFTLITMWDVIEHMRDPATSVRRSFQLLQPGGRLFIRTPNLPYLLLKHRIWNSLLGYEKCFIPLVHWWNFDQHTIALLLKETGFQPIRFQVGPPEIYGSPIRRLVQHLFHLIARFTGTASPFCFSLEVVAHKPM